MSVFAIYNLDSGEIVRQVACPTIALAHMQAGSNEAVYIGDARDDLHWIDPQTGERQDRLPIEPTVSTATGEATLSGLPDDTEVRCEGQAETVSGSIAIEFDLPGTYTITLRCPPRYLDTEIEVEIP
ncbi:MAG: hypothetical protein LAT50_12170 [Ectothiorhodospiraceae bacterium]|nr:hypothetical protein [Ectothiorhodospiraceae bacterium]